MSSRVFAERDYHRARNDAVPAAVMMFRRGRANIEVEGVRDEARADARLGAPRREQERIMPAEKSGVLHWDGARTVDRIGRRLGQRLRTVLHLPLELHPSLSACLYVGARIRPRLCASGGAEMLGRLARIPQLRPLAALVPGMLEVDGRLRVVSPAPHLVFHVPRKAVSPGRPSFVAMERLPGPGNVSGPL
jgi:hypothetical protein